VVQQRVRDAELGGELAHLRIEAAAREEVGGAGDDLLLALTRFEPAPRRPGHGVVDSSDGGGAGFCGIDHVLNSGEIVERLINSPHPDKP
jgi:hypothetical protein